MLASNGNYIVHKPLLPEEDTNNNNNNNNNNEGHGSEGEAASGRDSHINDFAGVDTGVDDDVDVGANIGRLINRRRLHHRVVA